MLSYIKGHSHAKPSPNTYTNISAKYVKTNPSHSRRRWKKEFVKILFMIVINMLQVLQMSFSIDYLEAYNTQYFPL